MRTPGHTIIQCVQSVFPNVRITLECTCGKVLADGLFPVDDFKHREAICDDGREPAREHLAQTLVATQS